jgi:hypothetical protein
MTRNLLDDKLQNKASMTLHVTLAWISKIKKPLGPGQQAVTTCRELIKGIIAAFRLSSTRSPSFPRRRSWASKFGTSQAMKHVSACFWDISQGFGNLF